MAVDPVAVRLTPSQRAELDAVAARKGKSRSGTVVEALVARGIVSPSPRSLVASAAPETESS